MTPPVCNERVSAALMPRRVPAGESRRLLSMALLGGRVDCHIRPDGGSHRIGRTIGFPGVRPASRRFLEAARRACPDAAALAESAVRFADAALPNAAPTPGQALENAR